MSDRPLVVEGNSPFKIGDKVSLPSGEIFLVTEIREKPVVTVIKSSWWGRLRGWYWRSRFYRAWRAFWDEEEYDD